MPNIQYSEDKNNPLNRKIAQVFAASSFDECKKLCREIYEMGISDGETFVWKMRAGDFDRVEVTEEGKKAGFTPESILHKKPDGTIETITVSGPDKNGQWEQKEIDYVEMVDGKLTFKHGIPDETWGTKA